MTLRSSIRSLRLSGWPRWAIAHLLRSNHPELSPRWIRDAIRREAHHAKKLSLPHRLTLHKRKQPTLWMYPASNPHR